MKLHYFHHTIAGPSTSTASLTLCTTHANESTENIDEIVQDHDTFGTDENEEDSMDSLTMAMMESRSVATSTTSNSSYMSSLSANKIGGKFIQKNHQQVCLLFFSLLDNPSKIC